MSGAPVRVVHPADKPGPGILRSRNDGFSHGPGGPVVAKLPGAVLVLACSATKRSDGPTWMPAWERYDGPIWRTYRVHRGEHRGAWVLSALFGLIPADQPIPDYNLRLTPALAPSVLALVTEQVANHPRVFAAPVVFVGGVEYASLLEAAGLSVRRLSAGGIGEQRRALRLWLA